MVKKGRIFAFFLIVLLLGGVIGTTTLGVAKDVKLGLDLQGGFEVLYQVKPLHEGDVIDEQVIDNTVGAITERVNQLGVAEAKIQIEDDDRIRVQLPGVENQSQAREILSTSAVLTFRDVNDEVLMDGSALVPGEATTGFHPRTGEPIVSLELKSAEKFAEVTSTILEPEPSPNRLVIWLDYKEKYSFKEEFQKVLKNSDYDPKYISGPTVDQVLNTTDVMITGVTIEEAQTISTLLNAGALPVELEEIYSTSVSAQFGESALETTVIAGLIGISLIFLYMLFYYRFQGVIACITLVAYIYLILVVFNLMNGVLTLPGIAALILGVGMAVDANVITYERIKEELRAGKSVLSAFKAGNRNSFTAILDANITTILAASVLFVYGTSSVKGFAVMLIVSIVVSFLTAVYGSRLLLGLWVKSRMLNKKYGYFGVKESDINEL